MILSLWFLLKASIIFYLWQSDIHEDACRLYENYYLWNWALCGSPLWPEKCLLWFLYVYIYYINICTLPSSILFSPFTFPKAIISQMVNHLILCFIHHFSYLIFFISLSSCSVFGRDPQLYFTVFLIDFLKLRQLFNL